MLSEPAAPFPRREGLVTRPTADWQLPLWRQHPCARMGLTEPQPTCLSACHSKRPAGKPLSAFQSVARVNVCPSVCVYVCLSVHLSVFPVCLSVRLFVCLCYCLSMRLVFSPFQTLSLLSAIVSVPLTSCCCLLWFGYQVAISPYLSATTFLKSYLYLRELIWDQICCLAISTV